MIVNGEVLVLTPEECRSMPDGEFREAWISIMAGIYLDEGTLPFFPEANDLDRVSTDEMRRIALEQQYWFNPDNSAGQFGDGTESRETLQRAIEILRFARGEGAR